MLSSSNGHSIFPAPLIPAILLMFLAVIFRSFKLNFFVILLGYFWIFLTIIAVLVSWKKCGFGEGKAIGIVMFFCLFPYLWAPLAISMSIKKEIRIYKELCKQKIAIYQPCQATNCQQSFIFDDYKRKYQIHIDKQCVTMKPIKKYDFLHYEIKKCGNEITEKKYHSTAKFLKNVALLKFDSVF